MVQEIGTAYARILLNAQTLYYNLHPLRNWMNYGEFIKLVVHQLLTQCSPRYKQLCLEMKTDVSLKIKRSVMVAESRESDKCHGMVSISPTEKTVIPQKQCRGCYKDKETKMV